MNYREKILSLRGDAMSKIVANSIKTAMMDLRSQASDSPTASRRWIWELIQNAKDVGYKDGVQIKIDLDDILTEELVFSHTGQPFKADNIRYLIEKISTKDQPENQEEGLRQSGKFGTGFISTHLLSEIVVVKGIAKEPELDYRKFTVILDRSSDDLEEIKASIQKSLDSVLNLDDFPIHTAYSAQEFNTSFTYKLEDELSTHAANKGIEDLKRCLPYTFIFLEEVNSVELAHEQLRYKNSIDSVDLGDGVTQITFCSENTHKQEDVEERSFLFLEKEDTWIAAPIQVKEDGLDFLELDSSIPRLFCDFPLVGSEAFPFPVVINSPHFNPTEPRDGAHLTNPLRVSNDVTQNKTIVKEAIALYQHLLKVAGENDWGGLHHLANIKSLSTTPKWLSLDWFKEDVLKAMRTEIFKAKIIKSSQGQYINMGDGFEVNTWFPSSPKKEIRSDIWDLGLHWCPHAIPEKEQVEVWNKIVWSDCGLFTTKIIANTIEGKKNYSSLHSGLKGVSASDWLNKYYRVLKSEETQYHQILLENSILPNQEGTFCKASALYMDAGDIEEEFKDILELLGNNLRQKLLMEEIDFDLGDAKTLDFQYVIKEINSIVQEITNDRETATQFREGLSRLLKWFQQNPEEANKHFSNLYRRRHRLYDEETLINNSDKAEQLDDLLKDYEATDVAQLKELLEKSNIDKTENKLLPITEKILSQMGITNLKEWEEALEDKDIKALFAHKSTPTHDMFLLAQAHIKSAMDTVILHLQNDDRYDLENREFIAPTVISDIQKNGLDISIVVRPAYNKEVIIYYGAEKDILDQEESELWIDDGEEARIITLGHILKSSEIRKFPI